LTALFPLRPPRVPAGEDVSRCRLQCFVPLHQRATKHHGRHAADRRRHYLSAEDTLRSNVDSQKGGRELRYYLDLECGRMCPIGVDCIVLIDKSERWLRGLVDICPGRDASGLTERNNIVVTRDVDRLFWGRITHRLSLRCPLGRIPNPNETWALLTGEGVASFLIACSNASSLTSVASPAAVVRF
jgi:hypothetical protein